MKFLLTYRFWLPFALLLSLELIVSWGFYEPFVEKESHSGSSIRIKRALKELGYKNVNYVTLGDSRADVGLNHATILQTSQQLGQRHISIAIPGSHFITFKIASDFLHADLSNLKGVLFAVSSSTLLTTFNGYYELGIIQPFRHLKKYDQVLRNMRFQIHNAESYGTVSSLFQYREDIKHLIFHPRRRIRSLFVEKPPWEKILAHGKWSDFDMCSVNLETPEVCSNSIEQVIKSAATVNMPHDVIDHYRRIQTICTTYKNKMSLPEGEQIGQVKNSWTELLHSLKFKKMPIVVLLPDSSFIEKYSLPSGTNEWALSILKPMVEKNEIILIDFRKRFKSEDECRYFCDPLHLNSLGMETITRELLPILKAYYEYD
jgi:hypothetical protein